MRRLTLGGANRFPIWSADGQRVTYQSDREGNLGIFWQRADGTGHVEQLTKPEPGTGHMPDSWSPDGQTLLFEAVKGGRFSLWTLSLREGKTERFGTVDSTGTGINAAFSPNGRWVAYNSGDGGATRVYVEPFPRTGERYTIPNDSARNPFWAPDNKRLFYAPAADRLSVVTFSTQPSVEFSNPTPVPRGGLLPVPTRRPNDLSPDGTHILGTIDATPQGEAATPTIQVVMNWFEELKRLVPVK